MVEGGQYPWKIQKIDMSRGPVGDYSSIKSPLPDPPENMIWKQNDETKEWKLVPLCTSTGANVHPTSNSTTTVSDEEKEDDNDDLDHAKKRAPSKTDSSSASKKQQQQYVEHMVLPTDTLQGLCLKYKITATKLRQANRFSGSNLLLAPSKLKIPLVDGVVVYRQDVESPEYKIHSLRSELPQLGEREARSYLEIADWNLSNAILEAKEDLKWEETQATSVSKGIVGTYVNIQHQRCLEHARNMNSSTSTSSEGVTCTTAMADRQAETAVPVVADSNTTRVVIPKFTSSAMRFFHSQEDAGMEMNPMMVPLLSSSDQVVG